MGKIVRHQKSVEFFTSQLTPEEREQYDRDMENYLKWYPYLNEPIMSDMLHEYEMMKLRLERIKRVTMNPNIDLKETITLEKMADMLRRTMSLYANRLGISFTGRQRRKEKIQRRPPTE